MIDQSLCQQITQTYLIQVIERYFQPFNKSQELLTIVISLGVYQFWSSPTSVSSPSLSSSSEIISRANEQFVFFQLYESCEREGLEFYIQSLFLTDSTKSDCETLFLSDVPIKCIYFFIGYCLQELSSVVGVSEDFESERFSCLWSKPSDLTFTSLPIFLRLQ